jgi:hypothetical protein
MSRQPALPSADAPRAASCDIEEVASGKFCFVGGEGRGSGTLILSFAAKSLAVRFLSVRSFAVRITRGD